MVSYHPSKVAVLGSSPSIRIYKNKNNKNNKINLLINLLINKEV
jgi:hypothetical protein